MFYKSRYVPIASLLFILLGALTPIQAWANSVVAHMVVANGQVTAKDEQGQARALKRRDPIFSGDTITTMNGFAEIHFEDGGLVTLDANSVFKINEYNWKGVEDNTERGFFELLKGGLRAISGAIGNLNKSHYRVVTPVATIGLRGTHYALRLLDEKQVDTMKDLPDAPVGRGLYGGVVSGIIVVSNRVDQYELSANQFFYVADFTTRIRPLERDRGKIFKLPAPVPVKPKKTVPTEQSDPVPTEEDDLTPEEDDEFLLEPVPSPDNKSGGGSPS